MNKLKDLEKKLNEKGYEDLIFIGSGAFSSVYRIRDGESGQLLACKISEVCPMAEREAELLQELTHPLFPRYVRHWVDGGSCFLVMEYIFGSSLQTLVEQRGGFSQKQAVHIAMELAAGLEFLHERSQPIIFRDVKPENVMIRADGRVKLVDVGCACRLSDSGSNSWKMQEVHNNEEAVMQEGNSVGGNENALLGRKATGSKSNILPGRTIAGSRGYAPPEQFSMEASPGRESDVYALGRLLEFMLWGLDRSKGPKDENHWKNHPRKISKGFRRMLQQAVQEDRRKRIPDMRTLQQKLARYDGGKRGGRLQGLRWWRSEKEEAEFYYVRNVRKGF